MDQAQAKILHLIYGKPVNFQVAIGPQGGFRAFRNFADHGLNFNVFILGADLAAVAPGVGATGRY
jgi:hypothetical protein